jgi:hypothetical protein
VSDAIWRLITGALVVAIIYMIVRPGSKAATAVTDISGALRKLVTAAAG